MLEYNYITLTLKSQFLEATIVDIVLKAGFTTHLCFFLKLVTPAGVDSKNDDHKKGSLEPLVTPAGVEPAIFWMRTRRPGPLDEGATILIISQNCLIFNIAIGRHRSYKSLPRRQSYFFATFIEEFYLFGFRVFAPRAFDC